MGRKYLCSVHCSYRFPQWTSAPCVSQDDSTNSTISGQSSPLTFPPVINEPQSQKVLAEKLSRTGFSSCSSLLWKLFYLTNWFTGKMTPSCYMLYNSEHLKSLCLGLSFKSCHYLILKDYCKIICLGKVLKIQQSLNRIKPIWWRAIPQGGQTHKGSNEHSCRVPFGCILLSRKRQAHSAKPYHLLFCCLLSLLAT